MTDSIEAGITVLLNFRVVYLSFSNIVSKNDSIRLLGLRTRTCGHREIEGATSVAVERDPRSMVSYGPLTSERPTLFRAS